MRTGPSGGPQSNRSDSWRRRKGAGLVARLVASYKDGEGFCFDAGGFRLQLPDGGEGDPEMPRSGDLLLMALALCTMRTLLQHEALGKGAIEALALSLEAEPTASPRRYGEIRVSAEVRHRGLSERQMEMVERVGTRCTISNTLRSPVTIEHAFSFRPPETPKT